MKKCFAILLIFLALQSRADDEVYYYLVRSSDNVTTLLYLMDLRPIYKGAGTLAVMKRINKAKILDLNHVKAGDRLIFPRDYALQAQEKGLVRIKEDNQIILNADLELMHDSLSQRTPSRDKMKIPNSKANQFPTNKILEKGSEIPAQSEIEVAIETGYSRIDSKINSSNATFLSEPSIGAHVKWQQNWTDKYQSYISWGFKNNRFQDSANGSLLGGSQVSTSRLAIGLIQNFSESMQGHLEIGSRQEIFAPSYSAATATLEAKPVSYSRFLFSKNLVEIKKLSLRGAIGASYLAGASGSSYDVKTGFEYLAQLEVSQKLKRNLLFAKIELSQASQKTSQTNQIRRDVQSFVGFTFPISEEESK